MGISPLCSPCAPYSYIVSNGISSAGKGATGHANGSFVFDVGAGLDVALAKLDGEPFEGSEFDGVWRSITVEAVYPISRWQPPEDEEPGKWIREGSLVRTWERAHDGTVVVSSSTLKSWTDSFEETPSIDSLDEDQALVPGHDEDLEDFGNGFLIKADSSIEISGAIPRTSLIAGTEELLPDDWEDYFSAATKSGFIGLVPGVASGISLNEYEEEGHPTVCGVLLSRWAATISGGDETGSSPPIWLFSESSVPSLYAGFIETSYNLETLEGDEGETVRVECKFEIPLARFSSAPDLSNPDSEGWFETGSPSVGQAKSVEPAPRWELDLSPLL